MTMLNRISSIFKAKANAVLDEMENPEEGLKLSLVEMREQVNKIKQSLVEVTTVKKGLESDLYDIKGKIKISEEQAELSMESNREDLAEEALSKKQDLLEQEKRISSQIGELEEKIKLIRQSKEQLEDKIDKLENKKEELIAMNKAAEAQITVKETMTGISKDISNINERISRAEHKIKEKNARAAAIDELVDTGALDEIESKDKIEMELNKLQREKAVKQELEKLKLKQKEE